MVEIYDTTLRDGAQSKDIYFSLQDKLRIALKLDEFGIQYIEGGWPGSNPKDQEFFKAVKQYSFKHSVITAFGSTRRKDLPPDKDHNLQAILESGVEVATIFGKAWALHVTKVLKTSLEQNLDMVYSSITYLREHGLKVIFDAEHFFDGYKANPEYALSVLRVAEEAGAQVLVLCDTNGGTLPHEIYKVVKMIKDKVKVLLGIHCHNDCGMAVANSIQAVLAGAVHVQGTINGFGERCGNADLCQIIPTLELKLGISTSQLGVERLRRLRELSQYVYELAGIHPNSYQPFVGDNAFAHKGGVHVDAVLKVPQAYEHIDPFLVGNQRVFSVSELSGKANILAKAREFHLPLSSEDREVLNSIVRKVKELENQGYHLENADATLFLLMAKEMGLYREFFKVIYCRMTSESRDGEFIADSAVKLKIGDQYVYDIAEGNGPVHAEDLALRKALSVFFPEIKDVELVNYRVSIADVAAGTASAVRVFIEFSDGERSWRTVGVSTNILEASKVALIDGYDYYLQLKRNPKLRGITASQESSAGS